MHLLSISMYKLSKPIPQNAIHHRINICISIYIENGSNKLRYPSLMMEN